MRTARARRVGVAFAAAGVLAVGAAMAPAVAATRTTANTTRSRAQLERQLSRTLSRLHGSQARLDTLSSQTEAAITRLNGVDTTLRSDATVTLQRAARAEAAARSAARMRLVLAHLEAVARRRRVEVRTVLQGEEVASADPLGALAPFFGKSLTQAVSVQSEMAMVGSATARALARAGRAVLAARREARRLERSLAEARAAALAAAAARARTAQEQRREAAMVTSLTHDRTRTAQVVTSLEAHAAGLRQAIDALLAAVRSGKVSGGTLVSLVAAVAQAYHVDPSLVWAVVMVESGGNTRATSSTGAQGLMQLEPGTAAALGVSNAYNAKDNLRGGTSLLASLIRRYHGSLPLALAAYTLGPAAVPVDGPVPAAARGYVQSVLADWQSAQGKFGGAAKAGG